MLQRALLFENLSVAPGKRPHRIAITVTLSYRGQTETAEEEASDTPRSRVEGAAKASVTVLDRLLTDSSIALEGAKIVEAFDREFAFVAVQGLGGRETSLLTGTAEIKESAERAAVFAVLDATNRWTEARRPGVSRRGCAGALPHRVFGANTRNEIWARPRRALDRIGRMIRGAWDGRRQANSTGKDTRLGDPGLCRCRTKSTAETSGKQLIERSVWGP